MQTSVTLMPWRPELKKPLLFSGAHERDLSGRSPLQMPAIVGADIYDPKCAWALGMISGSQLWKCSGKLAKQEKHSKFSVPKLPQGTQVLHYNYRFGETLLGRWRPSEASSLWWDVLRTASPLGSLDSDIPIGSKRLPTSLLLLANHCR